MRTYLSACLAALVFGVAAPALAHDKTPAPRSSASTSVPAAAREAVAVVDAFHRALRRGDTAAAAVMLADDAVIYESGGAERSRAEYASHHLAADAAFSKTTQSVINRRSAQAIGNFAWIATESTTNGSFEGRAINSVGTETMVLRRAGASWRIVHIHWSSARTK